MAGSVKEVEAWLHKALSEAFEERQDADYTVGQVVTASDAAELHEQASEFVARVRSLLGM